MPNTWAAHRFRGAFRGAVTWAGPIVSLQEVVQYTWLTLLAQVGVVSSSSSVLAGACCHDLKLNMK